MSIRATSRLILSTRSSKNNAIRRSCNAFSQRNYSGKTEWPPDGGRFDWRAVRDEVVAERRKAEPRKAPPPWAPKGFLVDAQPEPEIEREVVPEYGERPPPSGTDFDLGDFVPITPLPRVRRVDEATNSATGIGRRKTARAKVVITPGTGRFIVNGRHFIDYFPTYKTRDDVIQPLLATETANRFDIVALTSGGGVSGQAGAVRLGLARALQNFKPDWRPALKANRLLTRDPRMVERKKTGQPKARKRKQWSKR